MVMSNNLFTHFETSYVQNELQHILMLVALFLLSL